MRRCAIVLCCASLSGLFALGVVAFGRGEDPRSFAELWLARACVPYNVEALAHLRRHLVVPVDLRERSAFGFSMRLRRSGHLVDILGATFAGDPAFEAAVRAAAERASPFPKPPNGLCACEVQILVEGEAGGGSEGLIEPPPGS